MESTCGGLYPLATVPALKCPHSQHPKPPQTVCCFLGQVSLHLELHGLTLSLPLPTGREGAAERVQGAPLRPGQEGQGHCAVEATQPCSPGAGPCAPGGCV